MEEKEVNLYQILEVIADVFTLLSGKQYFPKCSLKTSIDNNVYYLEFIKEKKFFESDVKVSYYFEVVGVKSNMPVFACEEQKIYHDKEKFDYDINRLDYEEYYVEDKDKHREYDVSVEKLGKLFKEFHSTSEYLREIHDCCEKFKLEDRIPLTDIEYDEIKEKLLKSHSKGINNKRK